MTTRCQTQVKPEASAPFLCMRLMCSRNKDQVKVVRNELLKAGIPSTTRPALLGGAVGAGVVVLWVEAGRIFSDASKFYARIGGGASGGPAAPATNPQADSAERRVNGTESSRAREPRPEELTHARSLLEQ